MPRPAGSAKWPKPALVVRGQALHAAFPPTRIPPVFGGSSRFVHGRRLGERECSSEEVPISPVFSGAAGQD
jgi:hypothetical protein